jgi:hypothetical protein
MSAPIKFRVIQGCRGRNGVPLPEGYVGECDAETAADLFLYGRAVPVDKAVAARCRPASEWIDRDAEGPTHFIRPVPDVDDSRP